MTKKHLYEERITVWIATDIDESIEAAEEEALRYAENICATYLELAQAFYCFTVLKDSGIEVYSLLRESDLEPSEYLDAFFDTGHERQQK